MQTSLVGKVVDVARTEGRADGAADGIHRHAQGCGLVTVDVDLQLRRVFQAIGAQARHHGVLARHAQHLVARSQQGIVAQAGAVLQAHGKAGGIAQLANGRWVEREDEGVFHGHQGTKGPGRDGRCLMLRPLAFRPGLERHEAQGRILARAREAETHHPHDRRHFRLLEEVLLDLRDHLLRAVAGGARWQLDVDDQVALVFIGQEGRWQAGIQIAHRTQQHRIDDEHATTTAHKDAGQAAIAVRGGVKAAVEPPEEAALFMVPRVDRLEQRGAQGRREAQGQESREDDGHGHRQRELPIDVAHRTREESHGQKDRHQHHGDADHGTTDLGHGLARGGTGREPFRGHEALHVFNHHDGIVHQDADGQHQAEHGQHVDGEARGQHHAKGAHQCHWHHQGGDQGVTPVLQEQEHHRKHQQHGLDQGVHHLLDRQGHKGGGVVRDLGAHALGEELLQLHQPVFHGLGGLQRIGGGRELQADAHGVLAIQAGVGAIGLRAQLDAGHVTQAHHRAIGLGAQGDVAKLIDAGQLTRHHHGGRHGLRAQVGPVAQGTGWHQRVLCTDGRVDLGGRHIEGHQLGRVQPDAHGSLGAKQLRLTDATHTLQLRHQVARGIVAQGNGVISRVLGRQHHEHQEVAA